MKMKRFITQVLVLLVSFLAPVSMCAISGYYSDPGGGSYWCNVYVATVSHGKSYSWCTGIAEDTGMNNFRGFESEHDGRLSVEFPTIKIKFRYHYGQPKGFDKNGSSQSFYVMTRGGSLYKIGEWPKGGNFTQTDYTYGVIGEGKMENDWMSFRYTPNQKGLEQVTAIQIENDTYYKQDHFWPWDTDYSFTIHARYLRGLEMDFAKCRAANVEWNSPDQIKVAADNSWLPSSMGSNVSNFNYKSHYKVTVMADGKNYSTGNFSVTGRSNSSIGLNVPANKVFHVDIVRNTTISYKYNGRDVSLNLNENETASNEYNNTISDLQASPNQVEGTMYLSWGGGGSSSDGEFQIYRTELDEHGNYLGNRVLDGTTKNKNFTDNASRGMDIGKYYRYEVFKKLNSWGNVDIPSNPEPLTVVHAAEVRTNTVPVIPLHLVQDASVTDNIKMDWEFGNIPKAENDLTFKVHRIEPNGTITRNYLDVVVPRNAGKASFTDEKPESPCSTYGYFLQLDLADNRVHCYSDTVYGHVLDGTTVTAMSATKGTSGNDVIVKWRAKQVGTQPTLFEVQRRFVGGGEWLVIHEQEGTLANYTYIDNTTEPGRYYEYRVVAYAPDCDSEAHVISNAMSDVGFAQASGVISGRVQFDTGTAVSDVRVTISRESDPMSGQSAHSRSVLDQCDAITFKNLGEIVAPNKPYTLQFYVRPDRTTSATMTLMEFPKPLKLNYNSDGDMFDVEFGDNVIGSIPANDYTQLSVMSEVNNIKAYIAGNKNAVFDEALAIQPAPLMDNDDGSNYLLNESGTSLDGWTLNEAASNQWIIRDDSFCSGYNYGTAHKDVSVSESIAGCTVVGSVTIRSPWGARKARVTATMMDSVMNTLGAVTICDDLTAHDEWKEYTTQFEIVPGTRTIRYLIEGQDKPNWSGNYGPQFKNMSLVLNRVDGNNLVLLPDFRGNVDEIRVWNRALTGQEILTDVDRVISSEAEGLKAYINFDEGLKDYAFDMSLTNGVPNGHHVTLGPNTLPSDLIPAEAQLSSYGITNDKGEYEIRSIPFTGSGTRYSVYPSKGIHSFSPTSRSAFIGGTSLTINNVDFTDVSSFKVSGTIRYSGTTIPVDSVSFYVDGMPCNKNDKLIYSNANGEYEISVPIGSHYIEARRSGHTFEGAGRYPVAENETYEFLNDTHLDFYDNTLVTLAGRITGGNTEGQKPLGYGVSENTIGKAIIALTPLDHPQRMLNAVQQVQGTTIEWIPNAEDVAVESASIDINSTAYRAGGNVDDVKYIYITTDEKTGEFSAKVPPIRYMVHSVTFPNNDELNNDERFMNIPAVNLTNPNDTILPDTVYTANHEPLPLFKCNKKLMLTYRSNPVIDITQMGLPAGAFGTDTITVRDAGEDIKLPIYSYNEDTHEVTYNFGYPIFQLGRKYTFKVRAYEPYRNYDKSDAGELYTDMLRDSVVTFGNELGEAALIVAEATTVNGVSVQRGDMAKLDPEQVKLDSEGEGYYNWTAGVPSLSAPYTRNMNASMVIDGQTRLWSSEGLTGITTGVVPTGNNFITAGPSRVQMVLRDPPGDGSSATWATDSVTSDYTYTVRGIHNNTEIGVDIRASLELDFIAGTAFFGKVTYNNIIHENAVSWKYDVNKTWDKHKSVTYTNGESTSTSSTIDYVGRDGDVFIGYSTNYIIGAADKVGLFKQDDGSWAIDMQETMAMDEKFNTHFEFSQSYIENTLFNNILRTRNTLLKHINSMSEIEENPAQATYYTFLTEDDPRYGTSNSDKKVWLEQAVTDGFDGPSYYARFPQGYAGCDSVHWCNQIIEQWKKTLADNEEDKIKAFNDPSKKIGNESFERGSSITKSTGESTKDVDNSVEVFSTGLAYRGKNGYLLDKMGAIIISNTDIGYHQTKYDVDETTTSERFSYTLNDTQRGNAHTVDIFKSPKGWSPIFRTRGGQTRCPYEGETRTKYYEPLGQLLDYATMKSDNPHISLPVRNFVDIPAGQEAQVQVVFTNESETHEALTSAIVYVDAGSNPDGLQVYMDGMPLTSGVEMWIEYGVPITKTLNIKQSDNSILDYNDITLFLTNSCKPERWIYETASFSAHFVPAAPDVTLKLDKNVLNLRAVNSGEQVVATISDINRMFTGFKGVRLKYRFAGDSRWITAHEWLTKASYLTDGVENETQSLLPTDKPNITYDLQLPNIDGLYVVAAESMCILGGKEYTAMTPEYEVIRDTRGPKLLGQAYPNTGLLTPTDDIRIKFNEDIRESYLTKDDNFFITGSLNDAQVNHDVSLQFNGTPVETDAYLPIANTSFASTLWLKRKGSGTIVEHGTEGNQLKVAINQAGHVEATINEITIESTDVVPMDKWVFLAMNYVKGAANQNTLTVLMADDGNETMLFDEAIMPDYNSNGRLTLGRDFTGMMHELVLWAKNCPVRTLLAQKDEVVAPYLPGLVGYWKMNEGHGTTVTDYARSRNMHLPAESWNIENTNLAAHLDGEHTIKIPIGSIAPRETDSYVVETWFRGEKDMNARNTLLSVTDRLSIGFDYDNSMILHIYNDTLSSLVSNGLPIVLTNVNYNDGNWHHLALNVHRGVSAVVYIDGKAVKTLAEQQLPAPAGDYLYVGSILKRNADTEILEEKHKYVGDIDEIRVWNVACDGTSVIANRYNQVDTADVAGLIAYYPMERQVLDANGNIITEFSLNNKAPKATQFGIVQALGDGVVKANTAPALRTAPLKQNLDFEYTASSNEIYINLRTLPSRMQGNLLTFIVKNVRDMQDNLSETVTWSAVVDYNTLEWDEEGIDVVKDRLSDYNVTAVLRNKGRESGHFTITGLPNWIVPSTAEGVLALGESLPIQFTFGADAPVGTHLVYAYAVNDDDICSPLLFRVTITGNEPLWSVNPADYESSMNIIGQIYFEDKICSIPNTRIAAFVDGECRGVASPRLVTSRDAYFVNMVIYGLQDITQSQPITFRIYDSEQGVVLGNVVTKYKGQTLNLTYRPNDLIGDYDNPVMWIASEQIEQVCYLQNGWNWISLYAEPDQPDLESVFGHAKVFNTIKGKEGFAMNSGTKWASTGLDTLAVGNMYKLKTKSDVVVNISGNRIDTRTATQTIYPGWNWIGPLSIYNLSLAEAFADLNPTRGDIIKSKDQVAFYDGYKWEGDLGAVVPGMGYYYKSNGTEAVTFRYPTIDATYNQAPARVVRVPAHSPFTPVDHHQFSDNMNVVAHVMKDDILVDTLTVAAFVDGQCRGVTAATDDGYYLLTVAGNAEETGKKVYFATVIDGEVVWMNEHLQWGSDVVYGDLDVPSIFTIANSGVNDVNAQNNQIVITPTLVHDMIYVKSGSELKSVRVFAPNGARLDEVSRISDNNTSLNLSHLPAGVYLVEATTVNGMHAVKRIVKR